MCISPYRYPCLTSGPPLPGRATQECIDWAKAEKRTFLRQSLEARLVALYFDTKQYPEALALGSALLKELKKLDDKNLLVEVRLARDGEGFVVCVCVPTHTQTWGAVMDREGRERWPLLRVMTAAARCQGKSDVVIDAGEVTGSPAAIASI